MAKEFYYLRLVRTVAGLLIFLVFFCFASCGKRGKAPIDSFYADKGGWDYQRMPLIKPFEIDLLNGKFSIVAKGEPMVLVIEPEQVCVVSNIVFGKAGSQDITMDGKRYPSGKAGPFFCLDTSSRRLEWFVTENAMRSALPLSLLRDRKLENVNKLFEAFQATGCGYWIPTMEPSSKVDRNK